MGNSEEDRRECLLVCEFVLDAGEGARGCGMSSYSYSRVALDNRQGAKSFGSRNGGDRKIYMSGFGRLIER